MVVIVVVSVILSDVAVIRYGSFTPTHYCFGSCLTAASRTFLFCRNRAINCPILLCCQCCQRISFTCPVIVSLIMIVNSSRIVSHLTLARSFDRIPCSAYLGRSMCLFIYELAIICFWFTIPEQIVWLAIQICLPDQITRFCYVAGFFHLVLFAFYPGVYAKLVILRRINYYLTVFFSLLKIPVTLTLSRTYSEYVC